MCVRITLHKLPRELEQWGAGINSLKYHHGNYRTAAVGTFFQNGSSIPRCYFRTSPGKGKPQKKFLIYPENPKHFFFVTEGQLNKTHSSLLHYWTITSPGRSFETAEIVPNLEEMHQFRASFFANITVENIQNIATFEEWALQNSHLCRERTCGKCFEPKQAAKSKFAILLLTATIFLSVR